jgi:mRNA interferase RelE/StbE
VSRPAGGASQPWRLLVEAAVDRFLGKLDDRNTRARIIARMEALQSDPFPAGHKKLKGSANEYRIRIGDLRVLYVVDARSRTVTIYDIDRRDKIYR